MMRTAMKTLVCVLLLVLGFGAQSALACIGGEAGAHQVRAVASENARADIAIDRVANGQHCDCPGQADVAQAAVAESEKFALIAFFDRSAASPEASFVELRRALDAQTRLLSGASPASVLPPYLLTARLRC